MKQYIVDELRPSDHQKLKAYLEAHLDTGSMDGLFWMTLEKELWNETQKDHQACWPYYVALELTPHQLSCEFLIRTQNRIRCDCIAYANEAQRNWIIRSVDAIFEKLEIQI
jgi:hypothetical protein